MLQSYLETTLEVSVNSRGAGTLDSTVVSLGQGYTQQNGVTPDSSTHGGTGEVSTGEAHEGVSRGQGIERRRNDGLGNGEVEGNGAILKEGAASASSFKGHYILTAGELVGHCTNRTCVGELATLGAKRRSNCAGSVKCKKTRP